MTINCSEMTINGSGIDKDDTSATYRHSSVIDAIYQTLDLSKYTNPLIILYNKNHNDSVSSRILYT